MTDAQVSTGALIIVIVSYLLGLAIGHAFLGDEQNPNTIGGHEVPSGLECQEDEVIGYDPADVGPRDLTCVHIEVLNQ